jgi:hypothetical protein
MHSRQAQMDLTMLLNDASMNGNAQGERRPAPARMPSESDMDTENWGYFVDTPDF